MYRYIYLPKSKMESTRIKTNLCQYSLQDTPYPSIHVQTLERSIPYFLAFTSHEKTFKAFRNPFTWCGAGVESTSTPHLLYGIAPPEWVRVWTPLSFLSYYPVWRVSGDPSFMEIREWNVVVLLGIWAYFGTEGRKGGIGGLEKASGDLGIVVGGWSLSYLGRGGWFDDLLKIWVGVQRRWLLGSESSLSYASLYL